MITRSMVTTAVFRVAMAWFTMAIVLTPRAALAEHDTMEGRVFAGYQGWFAAEGDGTDHRFQHFQGRDGFKPGSTNVEMWPDLSEFDEDEKYPTPFRNADGSVAHVFSSAHPKTVDRHFAWMKEYGIDGVFLQRFAVRVKDPHRHHLDVVLENVRRSAKAHDRSWSIMYDLSGMGAEEIVRVVGNDWRELEEASVTKDPTYLHHRGRPVVTVWGIGFNDNRKYSLRECLELVRLLKGDREHGGNTVMIGVPYWWRTLDRDALDDPLLHQIITEADVVSPWAVGRFGTPEDALRLSGHLEEDRRWLWERGVDYMPVIFPGFSWHNMHSGRGDDRPMNQIPRLGGHFLWSQAVAAKRAGASMAYVAMFDEIDEGTAIMKVSNNPPVGATTFLTYEGLPSDHYLWLTGQIARLFRGELPPSLEPPSRE